jgi:hypothetical protein
VHKWHRWFVDGRKQPGFCSNPLTGTQPPDNLIPSLTTR